MKAIVCTAYGKADVLKVKEVNKPIVTRNGLIVRVKASSVSPVDVAFRSGEPFISRLFSGWSKPKHQVPGDILSGVIEEVGVDVTKFKVGERIFGHAGTTFGAHAEYILLSEDDAIIEMPMSMTFDEGAAIAYSAMTALPFVRDHAKAGPGRHLLINGGSGAIGTFAIQLAKHFGSQVTAVCGPTNKEMVKRLGADHVVDYTTNDYSDNYMTYDAVFDAVGKSTYKAAKPALKKGGVYLSTVPYLGLLLRTLVGGGFGDKKGKMVATGLAKVPVKIENLKTLAALFSDHKIVPEIDRIFSMQEIEEAHNYAEKGHAKGNVILSLEE